MPARPTLLIYAKPPRIGHAKARLAADLGSAVTARRLATMTLSKTLRAAANGNWTARLYLDPPDAKLGGIELGFPIFAQGGGDLTDRLNKGLAEANPGPVLFVGSDAPNISTALLRKAIRLLQQNDAVFGPAKDGGFWLFGINASARTPSPFGGVRWSTPNALADVHANLPNSAKVAMLDMLVDLDTAEDVSAWKDEAPSIELMSPAPNPPAAAAEPEPQAPKADTTPDPEPEAAAEDAVEAAPASSTEEVDAPQPAAADPEPAGETSTPPAEDKPKKKPGFFARLFGKKAA